MFDEPPVYDDGKSPIHELFDQVEWTVEPNPDVNVDGIPWATHSGFLNLFDRQFQVYILSDGRRIVMGDLINYLMEVGAV